MIARPDGTFLITKRVMTKAWAPGWWEVSGGGVQAGESSEEAVRREVKEETGLDVRNAEGGYVFTYKRVNPDEGDNYFVDVYRFVMDIAEKDVSFQEAEIDGHMFATREQIESFAKEGKFLHYDSIKPVSYTHLNNNASFYDRDAVFSNLGFDNFISIENMDIESRNEAGWAKDSVLTRYIMDTLQRTENKDVIYTISVQGHGAYPTDDQSDSPITVSGDCLLYTSR